MQVHIEDFIAEVRGVAETDTSQPGAADRMRARLTVALDELLAGPFPRDVIGNACASYLDRVNYMGRIEAVGS